MDTAAWGNIHAMFSKAKPSVPVCGIHQVPETPKQNFTLYGKNFSSMDTAAWSKVHAMFSKAKPAAPLCGIEDMSTEAGSESDRDSLSGDETVVPCVNKRMLPSMGGFCGAGGLFGGVLTRTGVSHVQNAPIELLPSVDTSFLLETGVESPADDETDVPTVSKRLLPSMGGFHGSGGLYGGVLRSNLRQDNLVALPVPEADKSFQDVLADRSFLPSMGSFHGAGCRYGGVRIAGV